MGVGPSVLRAYTLGECWVPPLSTLSVPTPAPSPASPLAILDPLPRLHDVKKYVLRSPTGYLYGEEDDLIIANRKARLLRRKVTVYQRSGEVEVPMSFYGPGGWTGTMRREAVQVAREKEPEQTNKPVRPRRKKFGVSK
jgi:hypothetical protein